MKPISTDIKGVGQAMLDLQSQGKLTGRYEIHDPETSPPEAVQEVTLIPDEE